MWNAQTRLGLSSVIKHYLSEYFLSFNYLVGGHASLVFEQIARLAIWMNNPNVALWQALESHKIGLQGLTCRTKPP